MYSVYLSEQLRLKWPTYDTVKARDKQSKENQAFFFNRRHAVKQLPVLLADDKVRIKLDN